MLRLAVLMALCVACKNKDDGDDSVPDGNAGEAVVVLDGDFFLQVGESKELTATTVNGEDESYTWSSSSPEVASVEEGWVTAIVPGETVITATGDQTGVAGELGVVVDATTDVPNEAAWAGSAHADHSAEAFNNWNKDGVVPADCAGCHSTPGFQDRIGADGSLPDSVDADHPVGTVIECEACHNDVASALDHVVFPSGVVIDGIGPEAICMTCHQGRSSSDDVDAQIAKAGVADDAVSDKLHFENIHYYAAGATLYAGEVRGGYQYADQVYDWRFRHVPSRDTCVECHDPHSLELDLDGCAECHAGVESTEDLANIRMMASSGNDYDGDGNLIEGLKDELLGLSRRLLEAIQAYPEAVGTAAICYDAAEYPYFFTDTDGDGACAGKEIDYGNAYAGWTPRLVRAAYNYQVYAKDPGAFAHNGKYIIQLLYDSIADLNEVLTKPIDLTTAVRNDSGHFNGASEAARHWDEDETVSSDCNRCHGGSEGFRFYLEYGVGKSEVEPDNGLDCYTCHEDFQEYSLVRVDSFVLPNEVVIEREKDPNNICSTCHVGRESAEDVREVIESESLSFQNIHYLPATSMKMGADGGVGFQYPDELYVGEWTGHMGGDGCVDCHNPVETQHSFLVQDNMEYCQVCHTDAVVPEDIRSWPHDSDYDGDGDVAEPMEGELETLAAVLLGTLWTESQASGAPLCYDSEAYPYFFTDLDQSGPVCDGKEADYANAFGGWTEATLGAAFNYQFWRKEPGAWAHNFDYAAELLIDSISNLGGDTSEFVRP